MSSSKKPLQAFVSFPSPYTQTLLVKALVRTLSAISITLIPPEEGDIPPQLQWADYDLISWDHPRASPSTHLTSSYTYRKALIRKHQLHRTISEYLAKCSYRNIRSILGEGGYPLGWSIEIQFADELDEALLDDLYELGEALRQNEEREEWEKRWYILKPGFADRAQGIRLFSTVDELQSIFESFEPPSDDEEDEDDEDGDASEEPRDGIERLRLGGEGDEDEDGGTGVQTSQMRHFVIQEYASSPVLFDLAQTPETKIDVPTGYKFHLRAYVLLVGAYRVYLSQTMLALFSGTPYSHPTSSSLGPYDSVEEVDESLKPHLTNTCLQTDAMGAPSVPEELVKLFWELQGLDALDLPHAPGAEYTARGTVDRAWLDATFAKAGDVISESVKAGVECGSFGLQFVPNAFEIFGVDLLCSFPPDTTVDGAGNLPVPTVTLLEWNASPDFHQSGDRLSGALLEMFEGTIRLAIAPFFQLETNGAGTEEGEGAVQGAASSRPGGERGGEKGDTKCGWRLIGGTELRKF